MKFYTAYVEEGFSSGKKTFIANSKEELLEDFSKKNPYWKISNITNVNPSDVRVSSLSVLELIQIIKGAADYEI